MQYRLRQFALYMPWILLALSLCAGSAILYARHAGLTVLSIQSGSMTPAYHKGDAIVVRAVNPAGSAVKVGDVVSYQSIADPAVIITHRITAIDPTTGLLTTRGDALATADPPFSSDRVVGVVAQSMPYAGYGLDIVRRPLGLILAVYIPAATLMYNEIRRLMNYYNQRHYRLNLYFD